MNQSIELNDDLELLEMMLADSKSQLSLYQPGPYWATKARNAANEIKRCGLADFRGSTNLIGLSYADNLNLDIRNTYNHGLRRFIRWLTMTYPLRRVYDSQVRWTKSLANQSITYAQEVLNIKERSSGRNLLKKYIMPYSLVGNCLQKVVIAGHEYSIHYLNLLEQHDNVALRVRFNNLHAVFEIGGGFGTNIHLLLENYKNIRKVLYLDIPPNLYVGTQYLRAFYGTAVIDYRALKHVGSLEFSKDDNMEIMCIAPWQIEKFRGTIDIFMNSHSFVEMPKSVVENYVLKFNGFSGAKDAAIAFTSYDGFDLETTFHPSELPTLLKDRKFDYFEVATLLDSTRNNLYFVSPGRFSAL